MSRKLIIYGYINNKTIREQVTIIDDVDDYRGDDLEYACRSTLDSYIEELNKKNSYVKHIKLKGCFFDPDTDILDTYKGIKGFVMASIDSSKSYIHYTPINEKLLINILDYEKD